MQITNTSLSPYIASAPVQTQAPRIEPVPPPAQIQQSRYSSKEIVLPEQTVHQGELVFDNVSSNGTRQGFTFQGRSSSRQTAVNEYLAIEQVDQQTEIRETLGIDLFV